MSTTTVKFARDMPKKAVSRRVLEASVRANHDGRLKELSGDRLIVLKSELGFMEMFYHVSVYVLRPKLFRADRMELLSTEEISDSRREAFAAFDRLSQSVDSNAVS